MTDGEERGPGLGDDSDGDGDGDGDMVASEQFPMFRLATLLARQLSSPIATRIKEYAKSHPRFGRSVCMRSGRVAAAAELRFKLWTLQVRPQRGVSAPPVLSDRIALDAGADLLGEIIIFALGAAIITFEYNRQAIKQEMKAAAEQSAWVAAILQAEELRHELEQQQRDLERLARILRTLVDARDPAQAPTPSELDPTRSSTLPEHDLTRKATPPEQDLTREATPPEQDRNLASTPPEQDLTRASTPREHDPTRASTLPEHDLTRMATPPEQDLTRESTPPEQDRNLASTPPEQDLTRTSTPREQDPARASHELCPCPPPVCEKK